MLNLTEENKYVIINEWYEIRNNIIQLYKTLLYCRYNNLNLIYPSHKYFTLNLN